MITLELIKVWDLGFYLSFPSPFFTLAYLLRLPPYASEVPSQGLTTSLHIYVRFNQHTFSHSKPLRPHFSVAFSFTFRTRQEFLPQIQSFSAPIALALADRLCIQAWAFYHNTQPPISHFFFHLNYSFFKRCLDLKTSSDSAPPKRRPRRSPPPRLATPQSLGPLWSKTRLSPTC